MTSVAVRMPQVNAAELDAVLWAAIGKHAGKECQRDDLSDGGRYAVALAVSGEIDGVPIARKIVGTLSVGQQSTRAGSAPSGEKLVAWVLSRVNANTRAKIARELANEYCEADIDPATADAVKVSLAAMRAANPTQVAGSVSFAPAVAAAKANGSGKQWDGLF